MTIKIVDIDSGDFGNGQGHLLDLEDIPDQNDVYANFDVEISYSTFDNDGTELFYGILRTGKMVDSEKTFPRGEYFDFDTFSAKEVIKAISEYVYSCEKDTYRETVEALSKKLRWEYNVESDLNEFDD